MRKHPRLVRYTLDENNSLSILDPHEPDPVVGIVVEGFTPEHALEVALLEAAMAGAPTRFERERTTEIEYQRSELTQGEAAGILKRELGFTRSEALQLVNFVFYFGQGRSELDTDATKNTRAALLDWARRELVKSHVLHSSGCTCINCRESKL